MRPPSQGRRGQRTPPRSEDFWTPRMPIPSEQRVRTHERAILQLLDATRAPQRSERDAAEIRGAQRRRGQCDVGVRVRPLRRTSLELPPTLVPRTKLVVHVEND